MISSANSFFLDSITFRYKQSGYGSGGTQPEVTVTVNATGVEFWAQGLSSGSFALLNSDVRLIAAASRQIKEPEMWNKET